MLKINRIVKVKEPIVSVWMIAYNHEEFIAQAIESVLMQKVSFDYNIVIGEDCSKDNTRNICIEYQKRFSDKIKLLASEKNIGMTANAIRTLEECKGKYIALLEGDDYWTDPYKLQKQIDFLEANPSIAGCFHDVISVDEDSRTIKDNFYESRQAIYTQRDCATWMGGAYATCSLVFRSIAIKDIPKWALKGMSDYVLDLLITEHGDIAYLPENMGAYRIHKGGIWQGNNSFSNLEQTIFRHRMCLKSSGLRKKYGEHFRKSIFNLSLRLVTHYGYERNWSKKIKYTLHAIRYLYPKSIKSILVVFLCYNLRIKNKIFSVLLSYFKNNKQDASYFLKQLFPNMDEEADKYPSVFNNGYLHIRKAIGLIRFLKLPETNSIVDVGAANGLTPEMFTNAFPCATIYAFEPLQKLFEELRKKATSHSNIRAFNKALGSSCSTVQMHVAARITSSSLLPIEKIIQNKFFAENIKETNEQTVVVDTLDASVPNIENINLIKIDVQGYELEVLKGGKETLRRTAIVMLEMQNHALYLNAPQYFEIDNFLRENGFELFDNIPSLRQDKKLYEWDSIYVNKKNLR